MKKYSFDEFSKKISYNDAGTRWLFSLILMTALCIFSLILSVFMSFSQQNYSFQDWLSLVFLAQDRTDFFLISGFALLASVFLITLFIFWQLHKLTKNNRIRRLYSVYMNNSDEAYFMPTTLRIPIPTIRSVSNHTALLHIGARTLRDAEINAQKINNHVKKLSKKALWAKERKASRLYYRESNLVISINQLFPELLFNDNFVFGYSSYAPQITEKALVCTFTNGKRRYYFWRLG